MSDSNQASHSDNLMIGPTKLALYDEVNDRYVMVGQVDNQTFQKLDTANVYHQDIINGKAVETTGQATEDKYRVSGRFMEVLDPNTLMFFLKNCGTPAIDTTCNIVSVTEEYTVFDDRCFLVAHNNGFYGTGALPAPDGVAGTGWGSGGTIPRDHYTIVVTGVYGETEGDYEESADVNVDTAQQLAVLITPPTGGVPDKYRVYIYNDSQTRADAQLIAETNSTGLNFTDLPDLGDYPGDQTASFVMTDTGGTPYTVGTDYTVDASCALVCIEPQSEGGAICNGQRVVVTYSYRQNQNASMNIGPSSTRPKWVHPVLMQLKDDDRNPPAMRGVIIDLYKVLAESGWTLALSPMNYESGFEFTWAVMFSDRHGCHGRVTTYNRHLVCYSMLNWAALTLWHNAEACVEVGS